MSSTNAHDRATEGGRTSRLARSIGAVLAGFLVIVVLSTVTDAVLHASGVFPPPDAPPMSDALFLLATAYRIVYGILGCWVTARLASDRPMQHALLLGALGFVISTAGAAAMWEYGPAWYSIAIVAISLPSAWIGGKLYERQRAARAGALI